MEFFLNHILRPSNHAHDKSSISDWKGQKNGFQWQEMGHKTATNRVQTNTLRIQKMDAFYGTGSEAYNRIAIDYLIVAAMLHYTRYFAPYEELNSLITPGIQKSSICNPNPTRFTMPLIQSPLYIPQSISFAASSVPAGMTTTWAFGTLLAKALSDQSIRFRVNVCM